MNNIELFDCWGGFLYIFWVIATYHDIQFQELDEWCQK